MLYSIVLGVIKLIARITFKTTDISFYFVIPLTLLIISFYSTYSVAFSLRIGFGIGVGDVCFESLSFLSASFSSLTTVSSLSTPASSLIVSSFFVAPDFLDSSLARLRVGPAIPLYETGVETRFLAGVNKEPG
jgi:hypothetical protein